MSELIEVASGLAFPEGPIAMPDGTVVLVEMFGPRLTRVQPDGSKETIAEIPGGPNGAAVGPGGLIYVCNNGGRFTETDMDGLMFPGPCTKANYIGGRIQTVDPDTRRGRPTSTPSATASPLWAPNDLVFDAHGGFYFTDHGLVDDEARIHHLSGIYYAKADGSSITEVVFPVRRSQRHRPVARRLDAVLGRDLARPHHAARGPGARRALRARSRRHVAVPLRLPRVAAPRLARRRQRRQRLRRDDRQRRRLGRLAGGELVDFIETGDIITTNICFGGDDLTTAYITISTTGRLVKTTWPRPGAKLHHLND